jgi:hypothetical protein
MTPAAAPRERSEQFRTAERFARRSTAGARPLAAAAVLAAAAAAAVAVPACGGAGKRTVAEAPLPPAPVTAAERMLAMLPQGAQVVVEVDLARLRANPVVGAVVARALEGGTPLPGMALAALPASPLAAADALVLAAYGVGTSGAAAVTLLAAKAPIADAMKVAADVYVIGPEDWAAQIAQRAALLESGGAIRAQPELLALRDHAMPAKAPGAALRVTARLPFDARIALARLAGLEAAPAQLSIWGDVVDDIAIVVDADASDPGDRRGKQAVARLEGVVRGALASLADEPAARALGVPRSLLQAKLVVRGTWVRAIIAIGPSHLRRIAARASALLEAPPEATP